MQSSVFLQHSFLLCRGVHESTGRVACFRWGNTIHLHMKGTGVKKKIQEEESLVKLAMYETKAVQDNSLLRCYILTQVRGQGHSHKHM